MKILVLISLVFGLLLALTRNPTTPMNIQFTPILLDDQYCHYDGFTTSYLEVSGQKIISYFKSRLTTGFPDWIQFEELHIHQKQDEIFLANKFIPSSSESTWNKLIPLKVSPTGVLQSFSYLGEFYSLDFCGLENPS